MIEIHSDSQGSNEFKDCNLICYCFGYTRKDIEKDSADNNGHSTILDRITIAKKAVKCDCAQKNPKGR